MKNYSELIKDNAEWVKDTFSMIDGKFSRVAVRSREKIVDGVDENGIHIDRSAHVGNWTHGFYGGLNLMLYEHTGKKEYLEAAEWSEKCMDRALVNFPALHHDVGFMWHILSGAHYRLTGDEKSKERNLFAAASLFSRYNIDGRYIRAWNAPWRGHDSSAWTIIDCMMNLPILYWASDTIGDDRFARVAKAHADTAMRDHIRSDGSVIHIVEHDRETGAAVADYGGQGYCQGSCWSRGQAWGLYGFVLSYIHTGEQRYLDAAKRIAHYFISNVCDDWLPRIDFRAPSEPVYYDSTAGACAACGLIEIAKHVPEHEAGMYLSPAINMLRAMREHFIDERPETDCMLNYGSVAYPEIDKETGKPKLSGVHISIIYGDYFYTEAILKLLGSEFLPW